MRSSANNALSSSSVMSGSNNNNKNNKPKGFVAYISEKFTGGPKQPNKGRERSRTAHDEISADAMKAILRKADVHLNQTLVSQLLISFENTFSLVRHVSAMIEKKAEEEIKSVSDMYDEDREEILKEIARRERYGLD